MPLVRRSPPVPPATRGRRGLHLLHPLARLSLRGGTLQLTLGRGDENLYGETVERRLRALADALGLRPEAAAA